MNDKAKRQYEKYSRNLLKVNPDYVFDAKRYLDYIRGPNWNAPDCEYAHEESRVEAYGKELLSELNHIRTRPDDEAVRELVELQRIVYEKLALKRAEETGVIEYAVNGQTMEYWTFYGRSEGWYFVRYDLAKGRETFRGANIPFDENAVEPIPAFLKRTDGLKYNYMEG